MQQRKSCPLPIHWVTTVDSEESVDLAYLSCDSGNLKILKLNLSLTVGNLKILKLDLSCDCQIWLQARYEKSILERSFYIFGHNQIELFVEIWQF
jgi:hypothetical protein